MIRRRPMAQPRRRYELAVVRDGALLLLALWIVIVAMSLAVPA
jgi:hypothetical protein